jgi:hypothetical protein
MTTAKELLTKGLHEGYAGHTDICETNRGDFSLKRSVYKDVDGSYHDEWLPTRTGGGQEIVDTGTEKYTRLYAGGVVSPEMLEGLGITKKEVIDYLIKKIVELGGKTRLFDDCLPEKDDDWRYKYQITDRIELVKLTRALETIEYKEKMVFTHGFEICEVVD